MAQQMIQLDREKLSCSICLELLKEPVTIPCGHNYCRSCIESYWNEDSQKKTPSCPQCRQTLRPRPVLVKNTLLVELVEEAKKFKLQAASPEESYAGPGDVACDFCTGRKLKALKSCLMCVASYCEQHLQPHYHVAPLKKHTLVKATLKLQENICSRHDEVMKIFCRTDQKCICYLCSMDEHKHHDTVSAAAERAERQTEIEVTREKIQQRIKDREKNVKMLQQELQVFVESADQAVEDSEKIFTDLICHIKQRRAEVKQEIRSQQEPEMSRLKELEEKLEQEISELRKKDVDLEQLLHTEDHLHFLNNYRSLSDLRGSPESFNINEKSQQYFEVVTEAVSKVRNELLDYLNKNWSRISQTVTQALLPGTRPPVPVPLSSPSLNYFPVRSMEEPVYLNNFFMKEEELYGNYEAY